MSFHFVDNNAVNDEKTRKHIRSHVAKGKNLGRKFNRPSRAAAAAAAAAAALTKTHPSTPQKQHLSVSGDDVVEPEADFGHNVPQGHGYGRGGQVTFVQRQFQEDLSACLPFVTTLICRRLFHSFVTHMIKTPFPPVLVGMNIVSLPEGPRGFLQYAFVDEAFFHAMVAMSVASTVHPTKATKQETAEALRHLSRSLRLMNERLSLALGGPSPLSPSHSDTRSSNSDNNNDDNKAIASDATLAVVIAMTQHERMLGYHRQGQVHFAGLQRLIELRGGIGRLTPRIAEKTFRADVELALQFGTGVRFGSACVPGAGTLDWLKREWRAAGGEAGSEDRHVLPSFVTHYSTSASASASANAQQLRQVFEDVSALAWLINANPPHIIVDGDEFHLLVLLVCYRLFEIRSLSQIAAQLASGSSSQQHPSSSPSPPSSPSFPFPSVSSTYNAKKDSSTISSSGTYLHLGLIAIMTSFFFTAGIKPPDTTMLVDCIYTAANSLVHIPQDEQGQRTKELAEEEESQEIQEMLLWLLFTAKASVFPKQQQQGKGDSSSSSKPSSGGDNTAVGVVEDKDEEDIWLIPKVASIAQQLGITSSSSSWETDIEPLLRRRGLPWINALQDRAAGALWDDVVRSSYNSNNYKWPTLAFPVMLGH